MILSPGQSNWVRDKFIEDQKYGEDRFKIFYLGQWPEEVDMITAEKAVIHYVNMNITALSTQDEEEFLNFLKTEVIVKPKNIIVPVEDISKGSFSVGAHSEIEGSDEHD